MKLRVARKVLKGRWYKARLGTWLAAARRMGWTVVRARAVPGLPPEFQPTVKFWASPPR